MKTVSLCLTPCLVNSLRIFSLKSPSQWAYMTNKRFHFRTFSTQPNIDPQDPPICKNCIHYIPSKYSYSSDNGRCSQKKTVNIVNGDIDYAYASTCRNNNICGVEGKLFEFEKNAWMKKFLYDIENIEPFVSAGFFGLFLGCVFWGTLILVR